MNLLNCILEWVVVIAVSLFTISSAVIAFILGLVCSFFYIVGNTIYQVLAYKWRMRHG